MATADFSFDLAALQAVETSFAPVVKLDQTNVDLLTCEFAAGSTTYRNGKFTVPTDVGSGTVTLRATGRRKSGTGAGNLILRFDHTPLADSEAEDTAYTSITSGALAVDTTAGDIDILTWTTSVATLGWNAGELVFFRVSRVGGDASDTLTEEWNWHTFTIEIPLA